MTGMLEAFIALVCAMIPLLVAFKARVCAMIPMLEALKARACAMIPSVSVEIKWDRGQGLCDDAPCAESEDETGGRSPISIDSSPRVRHEEGCISHEASIDPP